MRQCKFYDIENNVVHGGILTDDGDICGDDLYEEGYV